MSDDITQQDKKSLTNSLEKMLEFHHNMEYGYIEYLCKLEEKGERFKEQLEKEFRDKFSALKRKQAIVVILLDGIKKKMLDKGENPPLSNQSEESEPIVIDEYVQISKANVEKMMGDLVKEIYEERSNHDINQKKCLEEGTEPNLIEEGTESLDSEHRNVFSDVL